MIEDHSQYLLNTYARPPLLFTRGKGCKLYATSPTNPRFSGSTSSSSSSTEKKKEDEEEDKEVEYLDFTAGIAVNALGHADPQIASLLAEQAGRLSHSSNVCWNEWAGELGRLLVHQTKEHGGLGFVKGNNGGKDGNKEEGMGAKVFFTNSGTESNEGALKFARLIGKNRQSNSSNGKEKTALVCFNNAFHGRSMGALSVTPNPKYQAPFSPLIPNVRVGQLGAGNNVDGYKELEGLVTEDVCGVIVEPIQGEGGLNEADREWFKALGRRCREVGAVLIYDEIQVSRDFRCFACLRTSGGS
jgi:acetylornithine aminotransferase